MVDTDLYKLDKVSNTRALINMQRNTDCVELLLQNLLATVVTILFLLCFPTAQTLLMFALLPTVHSRLLAGILVQIALAASNSWASAVYEYYVSAILTTCNNMEICHASIDIVSGMSRRVQDGRASEQAEERTDCRVPTPESQVVQHPSSLKPLRLGLKNNVANTLRDDLGKNGKSHKRSGSKPNIRAHAKEDKENEAPNQVPNSIHRPGLKPLTLALTNPLSPRQTGHISGTRPAVPRVKGERRRSSVFYVSGDNQEPSTPVRAIPMQNIVAETSLLRQIDDLSGRLDEERNLVVKLRADVEDLQCQVRIRDDEVVQHRQQAMDLLATVDARGCIIRVLCANNAVLQQREIAWNQATWLNQYQRLICEMRWEEQYKLAELQICKLSTQVEMAELGHKWIFARFKKQLRIEWKTRLEGLKSWPATQEDTLVEVPCTTPSTGNKDTADKHSTAPEIRGGSSPKDTVKPASDLNISPKIGDRAMGVPSLPPSLTATDAQRTFMVTLPYDIIYEVDGRASGTSRIMEQTYANLTTANDTIAENAEYLISPSQDHTHDYHLQKDSDFYVVPQSAFFLPEERHISPSE